jgi:uncharacterized protein DUF1552
MFVTRMSLPRRTFLRGLGVTVALPLLDAMVPALSAMANTPATIKRRLGFVYVPNGVNPLKWTPEGVGEEFAFSPILAPLEPFRNQLVVLSELSSYPAEAQGDGGGDHARANTAWLTGTHPRRTEEHPLAGKSVDQYAADVLGTDTQFPSLQFAVDDVTKLGACEPAYACAYQNTLSWRTPTTPLPMTTNPRIAFERLLGGDGRTAAERQEIARSQRSLLDSITLETRRLTSRLGGGDRVRVDEYLDSIRELEKRLEKLEQQEQSALLSSTTLPVGIPELFDDHVKLMFDLQVLAYQADLTRVIAFLMSREATQRTYPQLGIPDAHHGLSHHGNDRVKLEKQAKIDTYHVQLLAYYLDKLRSTPDGDGSLLDHSLIMYGSCIKNGQTHSHTNLPTLLAGGCGGRIKGGRHIVCAKDTPLTNMQLRVLEKVDVRMEKFADSTAPLADL